MIGGGFSLTSCSFRRVYFSAREGSMGVVPTPSKCTSSQGLLGCSGDLASRLSNRPYWAYYGLLFGLIWDTNWTY